MSDTNVIGSLRNATSNAFSSVWEGDNFSKGAVALGVVALSAAVVLCVRRRGTRFAPINEEIEEGAHRVSLTANATQLRVELNGPPATLPDPLKRRIASVLEQWSLFRNVHLTRSFPRQWDVIEFPAGYEDFASLPDEPSQSKDSYKDDQKSNGKLMHAYYVCDKAQNTAQLEIALPLGFQDQNHSAETSINDKILRFRHRLGLTSAFFNERVLRPGE